MQKPIKGFTLLEILVVLGLLALILTMATPSMSALVAKWRSERKMRDLLHLVQESKAKSAQLGRTIVICGVRTDDQNNQCQKEWSQQVIAFIDVGNDGNYSEGDQLFKTLWLLPKNSRMTVISNRNRYMIRPNGTLKSTPGSLLLCAKENPDANRRLVIDRVGRVRLTRLDNQGRPISC